MSPVEILMLDDEDNRGCDLYPEQRALLLESIWAEMDDEIKNILIKKWWSNIPSAS